MNKSFIAAMLLAALLLAGCGGGPADYKHFEQPNKPHPVHQQIRSSNNDKT